MKSVNVFFAFLFEIIFTRCNARIETSAFFLGEMTDGKAYLWTVFLLIKKRLS